MDNERDYQMLSPRQEGKPLESFAYSNAMASEEGNGQTLDLIWLFAVVRRRLPVMAAAAIAIGGLAGAFIIWNAKKTPPTYKGSFQVLVEPVTAEGRLARLSLLAQAGASTGASDISKLGIENSDLLDYQTQIQVLQSPKLLRPVSEQLQAKYPDMNYSTLLQRLQISRLSYEKEGKEVGTKILEVSYTDTKPEKIRFVLDKLAGNYVEYSVEERQSSLQQGIDFINGQLPELEKRVDVLQRELQKLRQQYTLNEPTSTGQALTEQAQALKSQRVQIESELAQAKAAYANRQKQLSEGNLTSVLTSQPNPADTYENLIRKLQEVEAELALQSSVFREDSPVVQSLREKQASLRQLVTKEAQNSLNNVGSTIQESEARLRSLQQAEESVNEKIRVFPEVLRRYTDLERGLLLATESLNQFLQKKEALRLDASQRQAPWVIIAPPELPRDKTGNFIPASDVQTKRQLAIAAILSMLMGIGVGFVVEILHTVFHTPDEIKAATRLRLLGVIPFAKELKKLEKKFKKPVPALWGQVSSRALVPWSGLARNEQAVPFLEAFRSLYTNIRLIGTRSPVHSLVVGSAVSGDGKSTIALHLAKTAAAIGQRVLLVDADLRRPQLHLRLGLPNDQGLNDLIATDLSLNDAIQQSSVEENLFVMTAGQATSDPIKLLSSAKMQYLMEQFQAFFDLVIYDTPPLLGLADGNILAAHSDGIVIVVGLEKTDRALLTKSLEGLKISGATVLGIVANGIKGYAPESYTSEHRQYQTLER